ncbi:MULTISPECIES: peptidoglycan recognition family protein [unclassified Enterococcus]|uniref:peptidoglycan recognition protein family protein n=1 Tax=unclassified Enterococcus TaxID=2608891 RepID=UPI001552A006|nr:MULTISPECIES: peptidoglycan recognition family protein [unclassified Enterococcus]MBS7577145.1 N-acetylmuramoyl-L-alanine amidase [Enterococcus sp. MMGLQ5-2]MBS7584408.1 N-acetylmuramoyl-L-alanine amidase [Enterococcus sp. MMGLQ5-1]NPD12263.1 N-acetylmuramoyl-L-alanine amidase [Enterococcus sp. MMGLQ5-1]NPD36979.1 N-acetylmuramoyl-L-alanine amidase [Enterococcus sp. MMGLQ5-2]
MKTSRKQQNNQDSQSIKQKVVFFVSFIVVIAIIVTVPQLIMTNSTKSQILAEDKLEIDIEFESEDNATLVATSDTVKLYSDINQSSDATMPIDTQVTINKYIVTSNNEVFAQFTNDSKSYYVSAENIELQFTNAVNVAVENLGFPTTSVTKEINSNFEKKAYQTDNQKPIGVLIHDTGTEYSTIESEVNYMIDAYSEAGVFVHTFIDGEQVVNIADTDYMAQGAGEKANPYYIQFELTHVYTAEEFASQIAMSAYYTALMLRENNLEVTLGDSDGTGTIWTHEMVSDYLGGTDHTDPTDYWTTSASSLFNSEYTAENFKNLVLAYYITLS